MPPETGFSGLLDAARVILYHKQSTSAMTRFFKFDGDQAGEGVLVGRPLAPLARRLDDEDTADCRVVAHPGAIAAELEQWLTLPAGSLEHNDEFAQRVEVPGVVVRIYLMRFTTIDPPFAEAEAVHAAFVPLTQARGLPPVQMELLREAYTAIMGG